MPGFWERIVSRRKCCCKRGCVTITDDFNRPDAENLGPRWGIGFTSDWQISGGKAKGIAGDAIHAQRFPDKNGSMLATVTVQNTQYGDVYALLLAWYDADNYLYVKFVAPEDEFADQYWETILGEVVDGVATEISDTPQLNTDCPSFSLRPFTVDGGHYVLVSYDRDALYVSGVDPGNPSEGFTRCVGPRTKTPANRVGLAHGGGPNPIWVTYFWASEHARTNPECDDIGCNCGYNCLSDTLMLTGDITVGTCNEQVTFPVEIELTRFKKNEAVWRSGIVLQCDDWWGGYLSHRFWLICDSSSPDRTGNYSLSLLSTANDDTPCPPSVGTIPKMADGAYEGQFVSAACDPLELVFDFPYLEWWTCCFDPEEPVPPPDPPPPSVTMRVWITENVA
jgi:hypothetical protein